MSHPLARVIVGADDAPTLMLLHGITASAVSQTDAIDHWAALGYRVVAVDARGHGLSPRWTPQELERAVPALPYRHYDIWGLTAAILYHIAQAAQAA